MTHATTRDHSQSALRRSLVFGTVALMVLLVVSPRRATAQTDRTIGMAPVTKTSTGGQRWALVIGINDYANVAKLRYPRRDAEALAKALVDRCGFPKDNVILMTDAAEGRSPRFPTRGNLFARISQISATAQENDVLLVVFSGHGVSVDGKGYLVPLDGMKSHTGSLVSLAWVKKTLEESAATQRLLVLDACHSGASKAGAGDGPDLSALSNAAFLTMASCDSKQASWEDEKLGHGVFTSALIDGLAGKADTSAEGNEDGTITAAELYQYASLRTRQWGLRNGKTQTPVMEGRIKGRVELVRYSHIETPPPAAPPQPVGPSKVGDTITNSIGMKLAYIPAGRFVMGSPNDEPGREEDERLHIVTISKPFMMAATEVTQRQWKAVMGRNPSSMVGDDRPVQHLSWSQAVEFCGRLSEKEGRAYRLPTEAEWEYACRAGARTAFWGGNSLKTTQANFGARRGQTVAVGRYPANPWGLHDMHGNVQELCADWFGPFPAGRHVDPTGPNKGTERVVRGGSWQRQASECRSAFRRSIQPDSVAHSNGFRVVLELPREAGTFSALGDQFDKMSKLPLPEQDVTGMLAAYRELERTNELTPGQQAAVKERIGVLATRAKLQATLRELAAARANLEAEQQGRADRTRTYAAVGKLMASPLYNGTGGRPLLYRLVDPLNGLTIAYVSEGPQRAAAIHVGRMVGVTGSPKYDPKLRLKIIQPSQIERLGTTE